MQSRQKVVPAKSVQAVCQVLHRRKLTGIPSGIMKYMERIKAVVTLPVNHTYSMPCIY